MVPSLFNTETGDFGGPRSTAKNKEGVADRTVHHTPTSPLPNSVALRASPVSVLNNQGPW